MFSLRDMVVAFEEREGRVRLDVQSPSPCKIVYEGDLCGFAAEYVGVSNGSLALVCNLRAHTFSVITCVPTPVDMLVTSRIIPIVPEAANDDPWYDIALANNTAAAVTLLEPLSLNVYEFDKDSPTLCRLVFKYNVALPRLPHTRDYYCKVHGALSGIFVLCSSMSAPTAGSASDSETDAEGVSHTRVYALSDSDSGNEGLVLVDSFSAESELLVSLQYKAFLLAVHRDGVRVFDTRTMKSHLLQAQVTRQFCVDVGREVDSLRSMQICESAGPRFHTDITLYRSYALFPQSAVVPLPQMLLECVLRGDATLGAASYAGPAGRGSHLEIIEEREQSIARLHSLVGEHEVRITDLTALVRRQETILNRLLPSLSIGCGQPDGSVPGSLVVSSPQRSLAATVASIGVALSPYASRGIRASTIAATATPAESAAADRDSGGLQAHEQTMLRFIRLTKTPFDGQAAELAAAFERALYRYLDGRYAFERATDLHLSALRNDIVKLVKDINEHTVDKKVEHLRAELEAKLGKLIRDLRESNLPAVGASFSLSHLSARGSMAGSGGPGGPGDAARSSPNAQSALRNAGPSPHVSTQDSLANSSLNLSFEMSQGAVMSVFATARIDEHGENSASDGAQRAPRRNQQRGSESDEVNNLFATNSSDAHSSFAEATPPREGQDLEPKPKSVAVVVTEGRLTASTLDQPRPLPPASWKEAAREFFAEDTSLQAFVVAYSKRAAGASTSTGALADVRSIVDAITGIFTVFRGRTTTQIERRLLTDRALQSSGLGTDNCIATTEEFLDEFIGTAMFVQRWLATQIVDFALESYGLFNIVLSEYPFIGYILSEKLTFQMLREGEILSKGDLISLRITCVALVRRFWCGELAMKLRASIRGEYAACVRPLIVRSCDSSIFERTTPTVRRFCGDDVSPALDFSAEGRSLAALQASLGQSRHMDIMWPYALCCMLMNLNDCQAIADPGYYAALIAQRKGIASKSTFLLGPGWRSVAGSIVLESLWLE